MRQKLIMVLCIAAAATSFGLAVSVFITSKFPDARNILDVAIYCSLMGALVCLALGLYLGVKKSGKKAIRLVPPIMMITVITSIAHIGGSSPLAHTVHTIALAVAAIVAFFTAYLIWSQRAGN